MHFGNAQAEALRRKDGASPPVLGLQLCPLFFLLVAGLLLGLGSGAATGWCQPCPGNCTCANDTCLVNCSGAGLLELETVPASVTVLDLSDNRIETLDRRLFEQLQNLTDLDLSDNPWLCDCRMSWLPLWAAENGVRLENPDSTLCDGPPVVSGEQLLNVSFSKTTCGGDLIFCPQNLSSADESLLTFTPFHLSHPTNETCSAQCFANLSNFWTLDPKHGCFCGDIISTNMSLQCQEVCSSPSIFSSCNLTIVQEATSTKSFAILQSSQETYRLWDSVHLEVKAPIPVTPLLWDFGNQIYSTSDLNITHRYAQPGMYNVTVTLRLGSRDLIIHDELRVVGLPEKIQIICPSLVKTNDNVDVQVKVRGGTELAVESTVTSESGEEVSPACPPGSVVCPLNNHCYQLVVEKAGWFDAQKVCQDLGNGDMAVVSSHELQKFLETRVTSGLEVWIGFNDTRSAESLPAGKRFDLESCQNWLPGEPEPSQADRCVRMGPNGVCNTDLCSSKHSYVCEYKPQALTLNAEYFVVGASVFDTNWPLQNLSRAENVSSPDEGVEVLMFPEFRFTQTVYLSALEFVTEDLEESAQMRFQVYTPSTVQGCLVKSTFSPISPLPINESFPECEEDLEPSNYTNSTLPVESGCFPATESAISATEYAISATEYAISATSLPTQSSNSLPNFILMKEYFFIIPPGNATQYLASFEDVSIEVLPGSLIVVQHDAPPKKFLHCHSTRSYHVVHQQSWMDCIPGDLLGGLLVNSTVDWPSKVDGGASCSIRVIGTSEENSHIFSHSPNGGLKNPGRYTVMAKFSNQLLEANHSCTFTVVSPVSGLEVAYPIPQEEIYYVPVNNTVLVLKLLTGSNATAYWVGTNQSWSFGQTCPPVISTRNTQCDAVGSDISYAEINLQGLGKEVVEVVILVENEISSENRTIQVKMEEPIRGLSISPYPQERVLVNTRVNNVASVESGSDVVFKWTVDDRSSLTYCYTVFNVIYQTSAVYKLTLTASNHVSSASLTYNVTVEQMNPMRSLQVSGVPSIVTQNALLELSATIILDSAVEATFRWTFGDGTQEDYHFKPPYNQSFPVPDLSVHMVLIENNITHTYQESGEYNLTLTVFNKYENSSQEVPLQVQGSLTNLTIVTDVPVLVSEKSVIFQVIPEPSPFGVLYTWDLGDGTFYYNTSELALNHTYARSGTYNVSVHAVNDISEIWAVKAVHVYEEITGLVVSSDEPTERGLQTFINASVETGDNITWRFNMGDGHIFEGNEPMMNYTYVKDGNYTVNVTASNAVNSLSEFLQVRVYVLQVLKIEPSTCILENANVTLTAYVTGDYEHYTFNWTFGNNSSSITIYGIPSVEWDFSSSGIFPLSLILSSQVNKAYYYTNVCIEPEIVNVTLLPAQQNISLGKESHFQVIVFPAYQYRYVWDFGANGSRYNGGTEVQFLYRVPGVYQVMVSVFNNVSFHNGTALVDVQEPIGTIKIEHNGTQFLELDHIYLFSAVGIGTKVQYHWDFGDGNTAEGKTVTYIYNTTGSFTIILNGFNGVSSSRTHMNITVKTRIHGLTMNATRTVIPLNGSVTFSAFLKSGDDVRYSWILCDRCSPIFSNSTISYTFRSIGTFNVIVTAENELGSLQDSIVIYVLQTIEGLQIATGDLVNDCCFPTNKSLPLQATIKDGTNISYSWFILKNDSVIQSGTGKTYQFMSVEPETYTIVLKAVNMLGNASVRINVVFVETLGQIHLLVFPNPAPLNTTVNITMSLSSGSGVMYTWYLEESVVWFTYESYILYSFQSPGPKEVLAIANNTLGSFNSTITIFVQEPVEGLSIMSLDHKGDYVPTGTVLYLTSSVQHGTNVSWIWSIPGGNIDGKVAIVPFEEAGFFTISLNASNDVSWEIAYKNITVQDRIHGLKLHVSKIEVEPGELVTFNISLSAGSSVRYMLTINGDFSIVLNSTTYTYEFNKIGGYPVTVVAQNEVSEERSTVMISVLEAIKNLKLVNCCEDAIPARIEKNFRAAVSHGSLVAYNWLFDLQGHPATSLAGGNVTYTPVGAGALTIHISASNALGSQNISKFIKVQELIVGLNLIPVNAFVNRSVTFNALVLPSPLDVRYEWSFGDNTPLLVTYSASLNHTYQAPGDFKVKVNASNLISFWVSVITVTTRILECEEPEVQLELPTQVIMRRSQKNYIEAEINLRGCISYQTKHLWEIYKAASCLHYRESDKVHLLNVDMSRPQLVVPKLALEIGDYCFVFSVSFGDTPLSKSSYANVTMLPSRLVPIIDGGSYRVWSSSRDLILDGKKSYDPNLDEEEQTPLSYKWSCTTLTKSLQSAPCNSEVTSDMGEMSIHKSKLEPDVEYTFFLTISKPDRHPESTNQTVLIKKGSIPIVSLKCVSCKAQSVYEVSASSYVYLEGSCSNCQDEARSGRWTAQSFSNKTLILNTSTTTTGDRGLNLVLRQGVLKDGEGYTFTLHVSDPTMEEEGFASIDLLPNSPPSGGTCRIFPNGTIHALTDPVHFDCTGWRDTEDEVSLVFILRAKRCRGGHCDDFWVYKGSRSEHITFLPVGYQESNFMVEVSILVQDQQGATAVALNHTMGILMPVLPDRFQSFAEWLHNLTESRLRGLLKQGDPQHVAEYSLALITVLNEYEKVMSKQEEASEQTLGKVRKNITDALISLKVNTVDDIRQIAAALAQCTVASKELACVSCQRTTLSKLEAMMSILQNETTQGMMTPTTIADNILNIMGDVIHLVNTKSFVHKGEKLCGALNNASVASKAYNLSSDLMRILMKSRVLNEEPLTLQGGEILARGKRSDPLNLLCYSNRTGCQFFIPQGFNSTFPDLTDIIQVMFQVDSNPYPYGFISNYTVSTKVASMEFQTSNGSQIPVESLDSEKAITVSVANNTGVGNITAGVANIERRRSVKVDLEAESSNKNAGLHIQITYTVQDERYKDSEPEPYISVYLHETSHPNQYNFSDMKQISEDSLSGDDHKLYTFFIAPTDGNLTRRYYLNITNHYMWSPVDVTVGLYTSLCQYFDGNKMKWKTEGLVPLEDTRPDQAVCLTQHLTAFGASLFVPPHSVNFIYPPPPPGINYIVLLTCAVCFATYSVATIIVHKLDLLDVSKAGVIPFCGKAGSSKYEVLVKTGWGRGSGTSAHVGISLYGVDSKSGHRHLDGENTFRRNSVDIFQIATEKSLGNVWKIRLWHDNKGLSPSWYVQHVIIKDLQRSKNYFFLVNDWLSVGQEESGRRVEKEIFAASETELKRFSRIFMAELQRGVSEKHVWLSMWERPPRSRFTRVQRATCCALLIFLFLCANAVWYGVVGDKNHGDRAVSESVPLSVDSVAVGLVTSVLVYPIYLIILYLFRRARSKTCVRPALTYFDQHSIEIDNYLDTVMESSFMGHTGNHGEAFSDQTKTEIPMADTKSFIQWNTNDGVLSWPDLLSDPSIMGNTIQKLERHRTSCNVGLDASCHPSEDDSVVLGLPQSLPRQFLASDGASSMSLPPELRRISRTDTDLLSDLSNPFGDKTETIMLDKLNEKGQTLSGSARDVTKSVRSNRTVITDAFQRHKQMLPSWCTRVAHALSCFLLLSCFAVSVWIGVGFTSSVGLMWLISGIFSFLCSFFVLEPLKVLLEAVYFALVVKRLYPEEEDTLVECPLVEQVSERITKVRPPQGFALFQAREEAQKVKLLHRMLKNLMVYTLFLLVVLLTNYGDASVNHRAYLLQRSVRQEMGSHKFMQIKRSDEFWAWASDVLLPFLKNSQRGSYSSLLGSARLRQIRLKNVCDIHSLPGHGTCSEELDDINYDIGWTNTSDVSSWDWSYSPPDDTGAWYWGFLSFYDSSGYVQQLGGSLEENRAVLEDLQQDHWIDNLTRALFVEFSLYSPGVHLYSSVTLLLEFPLAGRSLPSAEIRAFPLLRLSSGTHLLLTMMVFLMMFVVYFVLAECLLIRKEGRLYFTHFWNYIQWLLTVLTVSTVVVYLSRGSLADQQWERYRKDKASFVNLHHVAFLGNTFNSLSASLLFLFTLKVAQQLRFIREWSVFGKTLSLSVKELCAAAGATLGLLLVYAQLGFLLFSSSWERFHSFGASVLSLFAVARGTITLKAPFPYSSYVHHLYFASYLVLEVWILMRFFGAMLINSYRQVRLDLFRPAYELQDYEMVELFLRRLRIWMGVSKVKEFRHKVRFEGMEPLPSRSSSDSKSLRGSTPSAASDTSSSSSFSTISSQLDTFSAVSTRERAEVDANIQRLLPVLETLLAQFDLVNHATEEVYQIERSLQDVQMRVAKKRRRQHGSTPTQRSPSHSQETQVPQQNASLSGRRLKNSLPSSQSSSISQVLKESTSAGKMITMDKVVAEEPALVPMQLTQNKRRKSMRAHNRVHPSVS
ncbi:polycystin-1 isoform X2 [Bufo gargarizans]|uniref:polycystin-1 isoform X2 n=1 Tax=Bufo gargarizans TaxID=30331 RepID=UPI001CF23CB6|nr:polycystin-1 isoform X2 [Bufo gargarizans]